MKKIFDTITSKSFTFLFVALFAVLSLYACGGGGEGSKTSSGEIEIEKSGDPAKDSFKRGVQHSLKGEHEKAVQEYMKSLELKPDRAVVYSNLGYEYYDLKQYDKSAQYQEKALDLDPELANAFYGLAMALERKGDTQGAIENYREFLGLSEPHTLWWNNAKANIERLETK